MTIAQTIYRHSLRLPEHAAREALDFIEFLADRYAPESAGQRPLAGDQVSHREALERLDQVRIDWGGKPIPNRDARYDEAGGG